MNIFPGFGQKAGNVNNRAGSDDFTLDGTPLTSQERNLYNRQSGDTITPQWLNAGGSSGFNFSGDERVKASRAGTSKTQEKSKKEKTASTQPEKPAPSQKGSIKRKRASKSTTSTEARSILKDKSSNNTLG